jgi:hypothetical protein
MPRLSRPFLIIAALLLVGVVAIEAQDKNKKDKPDAAQQADVKAMMAAVDALMAGNPGDGTLPLKWEQHHFIKALGSKTYVPFTLSIDPPAFTTSTPVGIYIRVAKHGETAPAAPAPAEAKKSDKDKDKAAAAAPPMPQYPFDYGFFMDVAPASPGQPQWIRRAFDVEPGEYDVYIAVREKAKDAKAAAASALKSGTLKTSMTVPSYDSSELTTSSIIVADKVDILQAPVAGDRQAENPYTFGQIKLTPSLTNRFTNKDDLNVFFWIYGEQMDTATKKPNVTVDFNFSRKLPEGEKFYNRTEPEELNATTLPATLDFSGGAQPLPGSLQVPLGQPAPGFPQGDYHLQIKVTDKVTGKSVARDVMFTVAPSAVP